MSDRYGASKEAWGHYVALGLTAHLLPVVSNPHAKISAQSKMQALGKTPSWYNQRREAAGIPKWTQHVTAPGEVKRWAQEPDYGICIQARAVRAIDIDVPDKAKAQTIVDAALAALDRGPTVPMRYRSDSGKILLPFHYDGPMPKRVIPVDGGIVEFLGDGQQWIAEGTNPSGARYEWRGDFTGAPVLTADQLEDLWQTLIMLFATGEPKIAREKRKGAGALDLAVHDDVAEWLNDNWEIYDAGSDGQLFIECPFADQHSSDSGPTSTAYFPAGTGGYQQGHFVCLHAHCTSRPDSEYLDATGYSLAQFEDLGSAVVAEHEGEHASGSDAPTDDGNTGVSNSIRPVGRSLSKVDHAAMMRGEVSWPLLVRDKAGRPEPTADNLTKVIARPDMVAKHIAYDTFKDELVWAPAAQYLDEAQWRPFGDADTTAVRIELERRGFKPMGRELLRDSIFAVAMEHAFDTAQEWLDRQQWDGVERIERFTVDCWGWKDSAYSRAVGRYLWTALAGRVIEPGTQADMTPILVGDQGLRKTSALQAMVPEEEFYCEIKLDDKDDNLARLMRGKLIGELEELRGLSTKAIEEIKAFLTRRQESWVPKFKEFAARYKRRLMFCGSTNSDEFLDDPTGERRFLPGRCSFIDIDRIRATRDQLWAEGAVMFAMNGIEWEDAERLAKAEHKRFKIADTWEIAIKNWLVEPIGIDGATPADKGLITIGEVMKDALGIMPKDQHRALATRTEKIIRGMGFKRVELNGHPLWEKRP